MEFIKCTVVSFYDELSRILTDYETGNVSELELYHFLVEIQKELAEILN